jgi:hypothetical protein
MRADVSSGDLDAQLTCAADAAVGAAWRESKCSLAVGQRLAGASSSTSRWRRRHLQPGRGLLLLVVEGGHDMSGESSYR